jgi:tetratricopeptide (TPR) repeat protein
MHVFCVFILICRSTFATEIERKTPLFCYRNLLNDLVSLVEVANKNDDGSIKIVQKETPKLEVDSEIAPWEELLPPEAPKEETPRKASSIFSRQSSITSFKIPTRRSTIRTSLNIPNFSSIKLGKQAIIEEEAEKPAAVGLTEAPAHTVSKRRTGSQDLFDDILADRLKNAELQKKAIGDYNSEFYERSKAAISKIGGSLDHTSVLNLVMPNITNDQEMTTMSRRTKLKELGEIIRNLINAISESNFLVICIQEAQHMDSLSWELLADILSSCSKVCVFIGTRLLINYENHGNRNMAIKIKNLPNSSFFSLEPFTIEDTNQLIISTWDSPEVVKVDQKLLDEISKTSDGRPLFIRSLVLSLKESGNFRISKDGTLNTIGEVEFGLTFDDRNIVISEFDRLERTFQLFLKVAAVIGQSFALGDVLYFLTGMPGLLTKIDPNNMEALISGVISLDRYGFLELQENSLLFHFKSSVVHKFVYSLMVTQQRQELHAKIARYFESKINSTNTYELLLPIYEHYMESGDLENSKKLHYLELVAQYHFENESMADSIKCYRTLLNLTKGQTIDHMKLASWYRELGSALFYLEFYEEAEQHLQKSLELQNVFLPPVGIKLELELKRQSARRQRYDKEVSPGNMDEDYIKSYPDYVGSGLSLNNRMKSKDPSGFTERVSPEVGTLFSILALADLYMKIGSTKYLKLVVYMGLNLCEEMPKDSIYCRFMALYGYTTYIIDNNFDLAAKYFEIAESNDIRNNIYDSAEIIRTMARFLFLSGNWFHSKKKYDALDHLGKVSNDLLASREALYGKSAIFYFGGSHTTSSALASELLNLGIKEDDWVSQYWGSFLLCSNLMSFKESHSFDLQSSFDKYGTIWHDAPEHLKTSSLYFVCHRGLQCLHDCLSSSSKISFLNYLDGYAEAIEKLNIDHWLCFLGFHNMFLAIISAYYKQNLDSNDRGLVLKVCEAIHKQTKTDLHNCILAEDYKHFFKGLKAILVKKPYDALHAWQSGADTEGKTESIYIHGCFHALLAKAIQKKDSAEQHSRQAVEILKKVGAENEISLIWQL